jgi:copper chaperone NosL
MKQITLLVLLLLVLVACTAPAVEPSIPPMIAYGEDVCDQCGMIIEDERFAAGLVVEVAPDRYEHRIFDDIGDMFAYVEEADVQSSIAAYYVHDYASLAWIDARQAIFVHAENLHSPMGHGLAAFAKRADAETQAQVWQGEILDFSQVGAASASMAGMSHQH